MAELRPYPFGALIARMFRELDERESVFDLPLRKCFFGDPQLDLAVRLHGHPASSPLGPAAGPHSQMAQNIVLSWLGGGRIHELKTVQADDELKIPRPCIDMQTVGYNVEWSQELKLEQSLEEYVKGAMLVRILQASGRLPLAPGFDQVLYDMSVGYDLAGIRSERVQTFIAGMQDCSPVLERLRRQIPAEFRQYRDLDFPDLLSDTLTLSTFHGCPPGEIESMVGFLLERNGLHCIVKLNPMLLGAEETGRLLHEVMGYDDIRVPASAFARDTTWQQAVDFCGRLGDRADTLGLGFGAKFTNTLIVENHRDFFPGEQKEMYLSGPPLHVLAVQLVARFRREFGDRFPVSFSAGIDRKNFPDAVALGLVPVTVCTDLLKPGGYGRARGYYDELRLRMDEAGAASVGDFIIRAYGLGGAALDKLGLPAGSPQRRAAEQALASGAALHAAAGPEIHGRWVSEALLLNTEEYARHAALDPRYRKEKNSKLPRKIGSQLALFDCISCDKCVPVCPNDANFRFELPQLEVPVVKLRKAGGGWERRTEGALKIEQQWQYANFADFCNDCGNCDVFCPEDGGPYVVKPRFFGSLADWRAFRHLDGFCLEGDRIHGRFAGREFSLEGAGERVLYSGAGFALRFDWDDPATLEGEAEGEVDLTYARILSWIRAAVYESGPANYLNSLPAS